MQLEVKRLQRRLGITTLFVTHDQEEALILSDRIAVMNRGRFAQVGTAAGHLCAAGDRFVADFVGESNLFRGARDGARRRTRSRAMARRSRSPADGRGAQGMARSAWWSAPSGRACSLPASAQDNRFAGDDRRSDLSRRVDQVSRPRSKRA